MKNTIEKTTVIRILEKNKIPFEAFTYEPDPTKTGVEIASILDEDVTSVYKTLVTQGSSKTNYVFVVRVDRELDLKKAAKLVGEKSIDMVKQKDLLPLTGYVHGGCSPIGMKKQFKTVVDDSCIGKEKIYFSAGKVGMQVKVSPEDLAKIIRFEYGDICVG